MVRKEVAHNDLDLDRDSGQLIYKGPGSGSSELSQLLCIGGQNEKSSAVS